MLASEGVFFRFAASAANLLRSRIANRYWGGSENQPKLKSGLHPTLSQRSDLHRCPEVLWTLLYIVHLYKFNGTDMRIVSDTSVIVAVIAGEPDRKRLIDLTQDADLVAPHSLHWELGNALAAQIRRGRLTLDQAERFLRVYERIPIQFVEVSLAAALGIAEECGIYAYDAYMIACAQKYHCPLLTLDKGLIRASQEARIEVLEVN